MLSRALAALLSLLVAASPVAAAVEKAVVPSLPAPIAPVVSVNALTAIVPTLTVAPALPALRQIADPNLAPESAGRRIDGAAEPKRAQEPEAPSGQTPVPAQSAAPRNVPPSSLQPSEPKEPQPPRKPAGFFRRLNAATGHMSAAERRFELAVLGGIAGGVVLPIALNVRPALSGVINFPIALAGMVTIFGILTIGRAVRFIVTRRDPVRASSARKIALATALGLTLGAGMATAPWVYDKPFVTQVEKIVEPGAGIRAVPGDVLRDAVIDELSKNPVGRDVLDGLRDRFGVIRMPPFFVGDTKDAVARYAGLLDAVTVDIGEVRSHGWTVEQFLKDRDLQRKFAKAHAATFAHELRHAGQSRRSVFEDGTLIHVLNIESEYESYITEHFWAFEKLKADPSCEFESGEMGALLGPLESLDGYLKETDGSYPKDVRLNSPRYKKWLADLRARWPAHQIEVNTLLAERERRAGHAAMAARYEKRARDLELKRGQTPN